MRIFSTIGGMTVATVGVLSLLGCDSLTIDQGQVNTDDPATFKCSDDDDCLTGYKCLPAVGESYSVCTALGAGLSCEQYNLDGDLYLAEDPEPPEGCFGLRGDCDDTDPTVYPGAPEVCDGKDNNCNGEIDEGLDNVPCTKQLGVCAGATTSCEDAELLSCSEPGVDGKSEYERNAEENGDIYSETELCDGVDNNCDGVIDEGCCSVDLPLTGSNAGENSGCNCFEGQAFACGSETGTCTRGVRFCAEADVPAEDLPCYEAMAESELRSCDPDREEGQKRVNSDGTVEFCVLEHVGPMEDLNDGCKHGDEPECQRGVWRKFAAPEDLQACSSDSDCDGEGETCAWDDVCRKENVKPTTEVCNGLDDDCDGSVDNHYGRASNTACGACPHNMVRAEVSTLTGGSEFVCVDLYEASRPDATDDDQGSSNTHAVSQEGVLPWTGVNAREALAACQADELRELVGGDEDSSRRRRVVPPKTLCKVDQWAQICAGEKLEGGSAGSLQRYPYGNDYVAGQCNDLGASLDALQPTGSQSECVTDSNIFSCTNPEGCDAPAPLDLIGNALEWVGPTSGINTGNPIPSIALVGGSYAQGEEMTCRTNNSAYSRVPFSQHGWSQLIHSKFGDGTDCEEDSDCGSGSFCEEVGSQNKRCVVHCDDDSDCNGRGACEDYEYGEGNSKLCVLPDVFEGDYSGFEDAGFRCCASPLSN